MHELAGALRTLAGGAAAASWLHPPSTLLADFFARLHPLLSVFCGSEVCSPASRLRFGSARILSTEPYSRSCDVPLHIALRVLPVGEKVLRVDIITGALGSSTGFSFARSFPPFSCLCGRLAADAGSPF